MLEQVLINDADVQENQERLVFVENLAESSVNINVRCWANNDVYWEVKWRLTENIKYALDDAKIRIPYPQLDVHVDSNS